ncbi:hypothetical protein [Luteimonas saliphila]|uniref:hypothetical protein n=1 Tax=Luteimonas saliphila TaxID=2804919 RepID=UPI00192D909A|nr:hypothetical protein [Luteimonas saliphila]
MRALLLAMLCCAFADSGAQEDPGATTPEPTPGPDPVTDMEAVRVVGERSPADPFAFRNPVEVEATAFSRHWDEPPSLEEIGMRGGLVQIAINKGLEVTAAGIRRLPGWRNPVQGAIARPPPLDDEQAARAARLHDPGATTP